jgi:hypothetical protein
LEERVIIYQ